MSQASAIFTEQWANETFPPERTDAFFEALYGQAEEGAYNICLRFVKQQGDEYHFVFELHQRPGKCLACNLTYGLPQVFARHPILNVKGIVTAVAEKLDKAEPTWSLLTTQELSKAQHNVPLVITFP